MLVNLFVLHESVNDIMLVIGYFLHESVNDILRVNDYFYVNLLMISCLSMIILHKSVNDIMLDRFVLHYYVNECCLILVAFVC